MNKYNIRINFKNNDAKVAFKTKETDWLNTTMPSIILMSVHSAFHKGFDGGIKMDALITTIKNHVKGEVALFMAEKAHFHTLSLQYQNDDLKAWDDCLQTSDEVIQRYDTLFSNYPILRWSCITEDPNYEKVKRFVTALSESDSHFQECLLQDAEASYIGERVEKIPNKEAYIEKAFKDVLEQCVANLVLAKKGYRFLFYPGKGLNAHEYLLSSQLRWISVFLAIEKKLRVFH